MKRKQFIRNKLTQKEPIDQKPIATLKMISNFTSLYRLDNRIVKFLDVQFQQKPINKKTEAINQKPIKTIKDLRT